MSSKNNLRTIQQYSKYVLFAVLLLLSGDVVSLFISEQIKHLLIFLICFFVIISSGIINGKSSYSEFKWLILPAVFLLIPQIIYADFVFSYEYKIAQMAVGFVFARKIAFSDFSEKYIKIISFICVVSVIVWITDLLNFNWTWLPISDNDGAGSYFHSMIITTVPGGLHQHGRNNGPFEEPGVFQVYINIALIFLLFQKKIRRKPLIVLVLGLVSTISTTGFICFFIIALAYLYENGKRIKPFHIILVLAVLVIGAYYVFSTPELFARLFGKFEEGSEGNASFVIRMNDIQFYYEYWTQNWVNIIFGGGASVASTFVNYSHSIAEFKFTGGTCTTIRELASYGLLFEIIRITIIYNFTKILGKKFLTRFLLCLCLLIFINTENFIFSIMFNALFYFGITKPKISLN